MSETPTTPVEETDVEIEEATVLPLESEIGPLLLPEDLSDTNDFPEGEEEPDQLPISEAEDV